ncbi:MAG: YwaF family protein [Clostridia bacterium]|nr:YwaF family protein [Clostridia bacterium]
MEKFFKWTAWPMTQPQSYGVFHLTFTFVGLAVVILLAFLLRKLSNKQNRILLLCIGLFLLVMEIYKQLFYFYVYGGGQDWTWWIFPFQLCSVPMYLCIFCGFCKSERINSVLYDFMFAFNFIGGVITFTEPSGINHPYWTLTLHAYIWHMLLIFLGVYLFWSKRACVSWKGYLKSLSVLGVCVLIAQIINVSLQGIDGTTMFFISPYAPNNLPFFSGIYANYGWIVNMILFVLALVLAGGICYYLFYLFRILHEKQKQKKQTS